VSATRQQQLRAYVEYLRDLGIYDLYRRDDPQTVLSAALRTQILNTVPQAKAAATAVSRPVAETVAPRTNAARGAGIARDAAPALRTGAAPPGAQAKRPADPSTESGEAYSELPTELQAPMPKPVSFDNLVPLPAQTVPPAQRATALEAVRATIGDCTRCPLAYAGRHTIVFADGDPNAKLMFVGEGPGADEDASGLPFVGKAGQLLNNMIAAMGLKREEVYIANIVKCRPPKNRAPEPVEANTCTQFLVQQIDIVRPQVIVALGKTAANYVRGNNDSLTSQRGQWFTLRGAKLIVTFHPAFLLRDPRQKSEAWKDLQLVMKELGLKPPAKA
jgi:uracil-DNA glycosylase family 4